MNIIFLDIDGVLNKHDFCPIAKSRSLLPEKVMILNGILESTEAKVVLSSAWRYLVHRGEMNLLGLDYLLRSHGVKCGSLVGITRRDSVDQPADGDWSKWIVTCDRGQQITDWLSWANRDGIKVNKYIVLDDMDLGISECGHPFIHIDSACGLRPEHGMEIIKHFSR